MVPGKSAYPVGKIELEVAFGDELDSSVTALEFYLVISCISELHPCIMFIFLLNVNWGNWKASEIISNNYQH